MAGVKNRIECLHSEIAMHGPVCEAWTLPKEAMCLHVNSISVCGGIPCCKIVLERNPTLYYGDLDLLTPAP